MIRKRASERGLSILHIPSLISPISESPPGGAEQIAISLARGQEARGCSAALVGVSGSRLADLRIVDVGVAVGDVTPVSFSESAQSVKIDRSVEAEQRTAVAFGRVASFIKDAASGYDIIHNHCFDEAALFDVIPEAADCQGIPLLHTLHCPPVSARIIARLELLPVEKRRNYVTVSASCADHWAEHIGWRPDVIENGIEMECIAFGGGGNRLLWAGRIAPEKGLAEALAILNLLPTAALDIVGRVYDEGYYRERIAPFSRDARCRFLGFRTRRELWGLMAQSKALLMPLQWREPFGLVVVEALACGLPVVAYRRGAMTELIEHGKSGFLVDTPEQFAAAVTQIDEIDRGYCRSSVEARWSVERMLDEYHARYETLLCAEEVRALAPAA